MALPTEKPSFGVLDGVKVVYSAVEIAAPTAAAITPWMRPGGGASLLHHHRHSN